MPDVTFSNLDLIPVELQEGLKPNDDGTYVINLVPNSKLKEFRDNNVTISKERDDLKLANAGFLKIVGNDAAAFSTELISLRETNQKVQDGQLTDKGDIAETVKARVAEQVESMKKSYEDQLKIVGVELASAKELGTIAETKFKRTLIDRAITEAVLDEQSGANPQALAPILRDAYEIFVVEDDGSVVPKNGDAIIYGNNGTDPMTSSEWLDKLKAKSPFYFKPSKGGGGGGGDNKNLGGFSREDFNKLSPQQKLQIANQT
jgi:hypothetical protein